MGRRIVLTILALALLQACGGPNLQQQVAGLKADNAEKKGRIKNLKASAKYLEDYAQALEQGKMEGAHYVLLTTQEVKAVGKKAFIAYAFPANQVHSKIQGTFTITDVKDVELMPGGKVMFRLLIKGKNVKLNAKIPASHKKKFIAGVKAGMVIDVVVSLSLGQGGAVVARPKATAVKLLKNNDSLYTNNIKGAINKKYKKDKHLIPVKPKGGMTPRAVFTTRNHVVIAYR
jgi:predicted small secreted protein